AMNAELLVSIRASGDHGTAAGHRLGCRQPETLVVAGEQVQPGLAIQLGEAIVAGRLNVLVYQPRREDGLILQAKGGQLHVGRPLLWPGLETTPQQVDGFPGRVPALESSACLAAAGPSPRLR